MGKSKSTQTQTINQTTTNTPTNPAWVDSGLAGVGQKISDLGNLDPYSLIAGVDPLQQQAANAAAGMTLSPNYQQASDILGAGKPIQASSLLENLQGYMSPYTQNVVDTTLANFDQSAGRTRAQQMLDLAGDSTFGGSGGSILRSLTEGELSRNRAATEATLRDQAFTTGAGLSSQDAARRQEAAIAEAQRQIQSAQSLADIGAAQSADQRAIIGTQGAIGDAMRGITQQQLGAPVSMAQTLAGLYGSLPLDLLHGSTANTQGTNTTQTTSTPSLASTLGGLAMIAAAPFTGGASLGLAGALGGLGAVGGGAAALGSIASKAALAGAGARMLGN